MNHAHHSMSTYKISYSDADDAERNLLEAIKYIGELHISNPNGLYLQIPDWPTHPGLYPELTDSSRISTKRIALTSNYDDDSIDFFNFHKIKPIPLLTPTITGLWAFSGNVVKCNPAAEAAVDPERLAMLIECCVESFVNLEQPSTALRKPITRSVKLFVWQRDGGKCVECGSRTNLEFDHVIPVIKGGSSTERNIRLLCESCNRRKGPNL